jgi:drug/metabolite transporter (DMT)-like permease
MAGVGTGGIARWNAPLVTPALSSGALILPLTAAFGYACGAIAVKRALAAGISGRWVNFFCNTSLALMFQIFWFFPGNAMTPLMFLDPGICGFLFFLGQFFTFRAIATGDVSIATPLLGAKVLLVALFSVLLIRRTLPPTWWFASLLASLGIALISYTPGGLPQHLAATIAWSLGAAALFALTDVFVQRWVPQVGYSRFAPIMFGMTGVCSLSYFPLLLKERRLRRSGMAASKMTREGGFWLGVGALLLSLQALGMYSSIGFYGSATLTNILYGSRCLWSVLLVWSLSGLLGGLSEKGNHPMVMGWRFLGALLLFVAMALVLY